VVCICLCVCVDVYVCAVYGVYVRVCVYVFVCVGACVMMYVVRMCMVAETKGSNTPIQREGPSGSHELDEGKKLYLMCVHTCVLGEGGCIIQCLYMCVLCACVGGGGGRGGRDADGCTYVRVLTCLYV